MKFDDKFLEGRIKYLAHTILQDDMWHSCYAPAETVASYAIYCLNVYILSAPKLRDEQLERKIEDLKFARETFRKFLEYCYDGGVINEQLEKDIEKTFGILGKYFSDLFNIYSLNY